MPYVNYGPGVAFILIVGLVFYLIVRMFRRKIRYPFCPKDVLSFDNKVSIVVVFQILAPLIITGFIYTQLRKINYLDKLLSGNKLLIPLMLLVLVMIFVITLAFIIERVLRKNNTRYYSWIKQENY